MGVYRVENDHFIDMGIPEDYEKLCKMYQEQKYPIIVIISTVLPGTIEREILPVLNPQVRLCYNPFFIAMNDSLACSICSLI